MLAKYGFLLIALLNGGWMLFDGIYVLKHGKYFGTVEPGPWSKLFSVMGIDPFALGPVFIGFGLVWLFVALAIFAGFGFAWVLGLVVCIGTLWYLPVGTVFCVLGLLLLLLAKPAFQAV